MLPVSAPVPVSKRTPPLAPARLFPVTILVDPPVITLESPPTIEIDPPAS